MEGFNCLTCCHSDKKRREEFDGVPMIRCKLKHCYMNITYFCKNYDYDMTIYDLEGKDE